MLLLYLIGHVRFIDYEYAGYNYQAFDIGNHFNEFAGERALPFGLCLRYPPYDGWSDQGESERGFCTWGMEARQTLSSAVSQLKGGRQSALRELQVSLGRQDPPTQSTLLLANVAVWYKLGERAHYRIPEDT